MSKQSEIDLSLVDFSALPENNSTPPAAAEGLKVQGDWIVWYDDAQRRGIETEQWVEGMQNLGKITNSSEWWRYWALLSDPARLSDGINLRIFREDVRPSSDDSQNENGGKWTVHTARQGSQNAWTLLIMTLLGGRFKHADDVCGAVLSTRGPVVTVSVWNKSAVNSVGTSTPAEISEIFNTPSIPTYTPHKLKGISIIGGKQPKGLKGGSLAAFKRINLGSGAPPGALVRNSVDGLAALKSGNLRASMDNARLVRKFQLQHEAAEAAAEEAPAPLSPEEAKQREADMSKAKRAFLNVSSDKFPAALMSPLTSSSRKVPTVAATTRKSFSTSDMDSVSPNPLAAMTSATEESPEWSREDLSTPMNANSPSGNILARLPANDLKSAKENWRKTATTIKPIRSDSIDLPKPTEAVLAGKEDGHEKVTSDKKTVVAETTEQPQPQRQEGASYGWALFGVPVILAAFAAVMAYQRQA
ncbi:hypothetical protein PROFUN_01238 [Planoprotostelium fungivorum]|uniref:Uncharacterized protein n=1 Tax=Planoprotostelium fungivorum TaxID=1890364 RepID=A0A2P6NZH4_9EUKA|nr:hypothetical protein PROFUN_01238 [Planoprotostelium fungivorum]